MPTPADPASPVPLSTTTETRHATAVAIDGRGVLITGPSGSGKSGLALQLIALGAVLVADDRTRITLRSDWPILHAPDRLAGVIEARHVGLLNTPHIAAAPLTLVVDMARAETERLPLAHRQNVLGVRIPCLWRVDAPHFPSAIVARMKGGHWQDG